jgi:hypothetical protein
MNTPCPYEKVILGRRCSCEHAERFAVGERIGVACTSPTAHHNCRTLIALLRDRARFALKSPNPAVPWPFGMEMRVMLGGLLGLKRLLTDGNHQAEQPSSEQEGMEEIENIHALVRRAQEVYGTLDSLPFQELVRSIARRSFRSRAPGR